MKALQAMLTEGISLTEAANRFGVSKAAVSKAKLNPSKKQVMTRTIEQLIARVRELEEENARLKAAVEYAETIRVENIAYFEKQLAASQLRETQLREALEQITKQMFTSYKAKNGRDCYIEDDSGELCYIVPHEPIITAQEAISTIKESDGK